MTDIIRTMRCHNCHTERDFKRTTGLTGFECPECEAFRRVYFA